MRATADGLTAYHYPLVRTLADMEAGDRVVVRTGIAWVDATILTVTRTATEKRSFCCKVAR